MSKVIDFASFKRKKQQNTINTSVDIIKDLSNEDLEQYYQEWFKRNNVIAPKSICDFIKLYYCALRYLEGTNNALSVNSALTNNLTNKDIKMLKDNVTDWMTQMIAFMKSI